MSIEPSYLVICSISYNFITKYNIYDVSASSETLFWTGAMGRIPITLNELMFCIMSSFHRCHKLNRLLTPNQSGFLIYLALKNSLKRNEAVLLD